MTIDSASTAMTTIFMYIILGLVVLVVFTFIVIKFLNFAHWVKNQWKDIKMSLRTKYKILAMPSHNNKELSVEIISVERPTDETGNQ